MESAATAESSTRRPTRVLSDPRRDATFRKRQELQKLLIQHVHRRPGDDRRPMRPDRDQGVRERAVHVELHAVGVTVPDDQEGHATHSKEVEEPERLSYELRRVDPAV